MKSNCQIVIVLSLLLLFNECRRKDDDINPKPLIPAVNIVSINLPFDKNPSGNWQIGYTKNDTIAMTQFQLSTFADTSYKIGLWHPTVGQTGYYPYLGQNKTDSTQKDISNNWAARAGEIVMEGSNSGQYSVLRFMVPASGKYKIKATFTGIHFNLSSTDVHILLNAQSIFDDIIEGYGGDSLFHAISGSHPVASYEQTIQLNKNDIITFAVGYGSNKNHYNDTTGLLLYIEAI